MVKKKKAEFIPGNVRSIAFWSCNGARTDLWTSEGGLWERSRARACTREPTQMWTTSTLSYTVWTWHWESIGSDQYRLHTHTPATVKTMPVAQMEVWNAIKKKSFVVWKRSVSESTFEPQPELSPALLVTHCFHAEAFFSLCSLLFVLLHAFTSLCKPFTATAQGCIHQSSQGTTANWFPNRKS